MIPPEKCVDIVKGLIKKTREKKAQWQAMDKDNSAFLLNLPQSVIILRYVSPKIEPDYLVLEFRNREGKPAEQWAVDAEEPHWPLIFELYSDVRRSVTGWDEVLHDIEAFLQTE